MKEYHRSLKKYINEISNHFTGVHFTSSNEHLYAGSLDGLDISE